MGNVKEQLENRARVEDREQGKKHVLLVGGSQLERISKRMEEQGKEVVEVWKMCRIRGEWTRDKLEMIKEELVLSDEVLDCIVIGGPSTQLSGMGEQADVAMPQRNGSLLWRGRGV